MRSSARLVALLLGLAAPGMGLAAPSPQNGKLVFDHWCAACHAHVAGPVMLPGTEAIRVKYKGKVPPHLEDRTDMTADFVKYVVRNGVQAMPFTRKTEITDAELDDLAAYLTARK